jgi:hypothetical protein
MGNLGTTQTSPDLAYRSCGALSLINALDHHLAEHGLPVRFFWAKTFTAIGNRKPGSAFLRNFAGDSALGARRYGVLYSTIRNSRKCSSRLRFPGD